MPFYCVGAVPAHIARATERHGVARRQGYFFARQLNFFKD